MFNKWHFFSRKGTDKTLKIVLKIKLCVPPPRIAFPFVTLQTLECFSISVISMLKNLETAITFTLLSHYLC